MKKRNGIWALVLQLILVCGINQVYAQQFAPANAQAPDIEVSDDELKTFVDISNEIRIQQQETQTKMVAIIEESDMGREKFTQIAQSFQSGQQDQGDFTDEEMQQFQELNAQLQPLQMQSQQNAMKTIENNEMEVQRFQSIAVALQTDQELQQRYMTLLQESQDGQ